MSFRATRDDKHAPVLELAYAKMAAAAAIDVSECRLLGRTSRSVGYFASRRFDRTDGGRVHVHKLCGLLHAPHRFDYPALSVYRDTYCHMLPATTYRRALSHHPRPPRGVARQDSREADLRPAASPGAG